MAISPNTRKVLDDMRAMGLDVSNIETQLDTNPNADRYLNAGVTRTQEFTRLSNENSNLRSKVQELAAAQSLVNAGGLDETTKNALVSKIKGIEEFLVSEGYEETEVKNLFKEFDAINAAPNTNLNPRTLPTNSTQPQTQGNQENIMNKDELNTLEKSASVRGGILGFGLSFRFQNEIAKFQRLYGRAPDNNEMAEFEKQFTARSINGSEDMSTVAADVFKFSEKETEIANKAIEDRIAAAREEERNKVLQEHNILPSRNQVVNRSASPLSHKFQTAPTARTQGVAPRTVTQNTNVNNGENSNNELPPFLQRGDRNSRMQHVAAAAATHPEIFADDNSYQPLYGRANQES